MTQQLKVQKDSNWLQMRFRDADESRSDVPLQVLMSGLTSLSKLLHLLSGAFLSNRFTPLGTSSELRQQFERQFHLTVGQSKGGSYILPLRVNLKEGTEYQELLSSDASNADTIRQWKEFFDQSVNLVTTGDRETFEEQFPEPSNARRIANAVLHAMPKEGYQVELVSETWGSESLLNSQRDRSSAESLVKKISRDRVEPKQHEERLTIIAQLEAFDLVERRYTARSNDGLVIQGDADTDLSTLDIEFSPAQVEIDGTFEVDDNDNIRSTKSVESSRYIDTSPITVTELRVNNEHLIANPPLNYKVEFLPRDACYILDGDLGLSLHAYSRSELESVLNESLESWWLNYAMEDDGNLSPGAIKLKQQLLARFSTA